MRLIGSSFSTISERSSFKYLRGVKTHLLWKCRSTNRTQFVRTNLSKIANAIRSAESVGDTSVFGRWREYRNKTFEN